MYADKKLWPMMKNLEKKQLSTKIARHVAFLVPDYKWAERKANR